MQGCYRVKSYKTLIIQNPLVNPGDFVYLANPKCGSPNKGLIHLPQILQREPGMYEAIEIADNIIRITAQ
jgi:hypothetical protein